MGVRAETRAKIDSPRGGLPRRSSHSEGGTEPAERMGAGRSQRASEAGGGVRGAKPL